ALISYLLFSTSCFWRPREPNWQRESQSIQFEKRRRREKEMEMDEYFPLGQDEAVTDEDEFDTDDDEEEDDEDDYAVESVRRAYFGGGGRTVDFPAPSSAFNGTNHQPHHEISLAASSSPASNSPSLKHKVVPAAFPIKKRKRRSACHS